MLSEKRKVRAEGPRFLLYSHDSWGLGHLRRNLSLAASLSKSYPDSSTVIVTGSPCATFFRLPDGVELVKMPSVTKNKEGEYVPRQMRTSLAFVLGMRQQILQEVFRSFHPDAVIIDHQVLGLRHEAMPVLWEAKRQGVKTILGVRDIIDGPDAVAKEWGTPEARWALEEGYDRVCVYGTPEVFDPRIEYPIPAELGKRLEFCGYVVRPYENGRPTGTNERTRITVTVGGGEDGADRIDAYLEALSMRRPDWETDIVGGPLLRRRDAHRLRERTLSLRLDNVRLHRFHANLPHLLAKSDAVVSMAGYNTCVEIMQSGKPAVFMPRTYPRMEQSIRATRLEQIGLGRSVEDMNPVDILAGIEEGLAGGSTTDLAPRLDGAENLSRVVGNLLGLSPQKGAERPTSTLAS